MKCWQPPMDAAVHEFAVCQGLIAAVLAIATSREAVVSKVHVGIGPLSGVEPHLLAAAYPLVSAGTAADGSELAIEETRLLVRCEACGAESAATPSRLLCGRCGGWRTKVTEGEELLLLRVELQPGESSSGEAHV